MVLAARKLRQRLALRRLKAEHRVGAGENLNIEYLIQSKRDYEMDIVVLKSGVQIGFSTEADDPSGLAYLSHFPWTSG